MISIGLAAAGLALQALPAPGTRDFDIQCFALLSVASDNNSDDANAVALQMATMFYFGRVDSQIGMEALGPEIEAFADQADAGNVDLDALAQACGDFMSERGTALEALGNQLIERGY